MPASAGIANSTTGIAGAGPDGRVNAAGAGAQVRPGLGLQLGCGGWVCPPPPPCEGLGDGLTMRWPQSPGKLPSPGMWVMGYLSFAGSALGSLMLPLLPHCPLTTRLAKVRAAVTHVSGRPWPWTNTGRFKQPLVHELSGAGSVPVSIGTWTVRGHDGLGANPVQRQTFVITTPSGIATSLSGACFLPFQSHGLLTAMFMYSCHRYSGPVAANRLFAIFDWLLFPIQTPVTR